MAMVETKVPKNIKRYKAKIVGNMFTARQVVCAMVALVTDIILLRVIKAFTSEIIVIGVVLFIIDLIIISFCFEVDGLYLDEYTFKVLIPSLKNPSKRYVIKKSETHQNKITFNKKTMKKKREALYKERPELKPIR